MSLSTITSKFQTTVPREVRRRLKLVRNAVLDWNVEGGRAVVTPREPRLLAHAGRIKVGKGSFRAERDAARRLQALDVAGKGRP
jgi:bifunctional DNA-binding transcriptional regulator/antitoxin component of YhaV-PrlF toxin-antitoxin module